MYFLVFDFSSSHHDSFRDTISWECVVKNDGVRSRLIELQSFLLNKFYVDPIHRVLMLSSTALCMVLCKTRCSQVDRVRIPCLTTLSLDTVENVMVGEVDELEEDVG